MFSTHLEVFLVPSFLFIQGARSQPGSYLPIEFIFPILSLRLVLRQRRSGSPLSLSMLNVFSGEGTLAMARRVLLDLGLVTSRTCILTSLEQSLWSSLRPSLLRALRPLLVQLTVLEGERQLRLRGLA